MLRIDIPPEITDELELVTTATLDPDSATEGSVQMEVLTSNPGPLDNKGTGDAPALPASRHISLKVPILVREGSATQGRLEAAFQSFRAVFPPALCYAKIVPADEVITLMLFYREDDQLCRLMLDARQKARLDRLWDELHYISGDALTMVDAYEQLLQYAGQDGDPKVFATMRESIKLGADSHRKRELDSEPRHLESLLRIASDAYRRALSDGESKELEGFYRKSRTMGLPHDESVRLVLARVFLAPAFLYHGEKPSAGTEQAPVSDWELANRLSYFLWSSAPDAELRASAAAGTLHSTAELLAQTRRMLGDPKVRRLATEFGCAWLHIHDFDESNEKSEKEFPTFAALRGDMYEESIRCFTDLFQTIALYWISWGQITLS